MYSSLPSSTIEKDYCIITEYMKKIGISTSEIEKIGPPKIVSRKGPPKIYKTALLPPLWPIGYLFLFHLMPAQRKKDTYICWTTCRD